MYTVIYADPPWRYGDKCLHRGGAERHYQTVGLPALVALPVQNLANEDAALFLWSTSPMLPEAMQVLNAWGFAYKTIAFTWVKTTKKSGDLAWGMGHWTRANAEHVLLGIRGKPKRVSAAVHQVVISPRTKHSQKPDEVRQRIETLMGDVPRVELFARKQAPGWDVWGIDVEPALAIVTTLGTRA